MTSKATPNLRIHSDYLGEPSLLFADGREHIDPKLGISRFGPKSYSPRRHHPASIRVGFIGTAETMAATEKWLVTTSEGVPGDEKHPEFPGFMPDRGFFSQLEFDKDWDAQLYQQDISSLLDMRGSRQRFEALLLLLEEKLDLLSKKDQSPQYIVVALPDSIYKRCRVVDYRDKTLGAVHRDLRRAFKAIAMRYKTPTQLVLQHTIDGREKDHPSKVAWNFFCGLYFKAGGSPWGPVGLIPGTCYAGIGFYRALGCASSTMHTSLVQAFDEHGDGLILRGPDEIDWDPEKQGTRSPHLSEAQAANLVNYMLDRYQAEMKQTPQRVVVHKSSRFWPEERTGFRKALQGKAQQFDLLSLDTRQSVVRLITPNIYPPLRGTHFTIGEMDYLYTTGFIADLGQFHSLHVPSPVRVTDHVGQDTPRETLLREILILTKMNWNSSRLGGKSPITLTFSDIVGEIMREIPRDHDPMPQFKFYM